MNRRSFLKGLAAAAAAAAVPTNFLAAPTCKCGKRHTGKISEEDKVAFIKQLLDDAIASHDRMIEERVFATNT